VGPAAPGVELADQLQQPGGGGVEVSRERGDLVAEPAEIVRGGGGRKRRRNMHDWPPGSHSITRFSGTWEAT
jgi:hypothetical protein